MGNISDVMLEYLQDNERFSDLFNGCCFHGRHVIDAGDLSEGSETYTEQPEWPRSGAGGPGSNKRGRTKQRARDLKKWHRYGAVLRVLALEDQEHVDYTAPWRFMNYDALEYGRQIGKLKSRNHREKTLKAGGEYLCGLRREDRLIPVYTICLYHGEEIWDGPRSLKDMMDFGEDRKDWEGLFSDYRIHLVCLNEMGEMGCFHSPLKEVFALVPHRKDKKALRELMERDPAYRGLDGETARVAGALIGVKDMEEKMKRYQEEDGFDMCTALKEMLEDSRNEGYHLGVSQGITQGVSLGTDKKARQAAVNLFKRGFSAEDIAVILEESVEKILQWKP